MVIVVAERPPAAIDVRQRIIGVGRNGPRNRLRVKPETVVLPTKSVLGILHLQLSHKRSMVFNGAQVAVVGRVHMDLVLKSESADPLVVRVEHAVHQRDGVLRVGGVIKGAASAQCQVISSVPSLHEAVHGGNPRVAGEEVGVIEASRRQQGPGRLDPFSEVQVVNGLAVQAVAVLLIPVVHHVKIGLSASTTHGGGSAQVGPRQSGEGDR